MIRTYVRVFFGRQAARSAGCGGQVIRFGLLIICYSNSKCLGVHPRFWRQTIGIALGCFFFGSYSKI